tara:strand:+ start:3197 stop:3427 length:231 start_codon:yes stop_codon:yes gene_type:complete
MNFVGEGQINNLFLSTFCPKFSELIRFDLPLQGVKEGQKRKVKKARATATTATETPVPVACKERFRDSTVFSCSSR